MKIWRLIRVSIILATLAFAAGWVTKVSAAPAAPTDLVLTQPDGTSIAGRQWGDEWQNGFETVDGYTIVQASDGWWVYATATQNGALAPALRADQTPRVVGSDSPEGLPLHLRPTGQTVPTGTSGLYSANSGSQPVLVLLASFSNRAGTYSADSFASLIFGASNSVRDFYLDASFNQLSLNPVSETNGTANDGVIGWLNLGYAHPNTGGSTSDANQLIVKNALIAADPYIDYSIYDTNHDNYISNNELHIIVVVAGYETSYDNNTPAVWAHRWSLNSVTPPTLDGKVLGSYPYGGYAQFGEIHGDHQATIGVMAHELGHDLTWPDLYDTDNTSEGVGNWSIMGAGSWNYSSGNYGSSPAMPDAWLKWYQGWIAPTVVNGTQSGAAIQQAETNAQAYLLRPNPNGVDWNFEVTSGSGEYFLVENRQLTGYDAGLPGCGLLVWHIDEAVTSDNTANANENHPLVKVMEADGLNQLKTAVNRGDAGDPFPGTSNKVTFNYSSTPNSRLYSGADSLASVTNISSACAATMTANLTYAPSSFSVNVSKTGTGSGTVASSPAGISCGSTCSASFPYNSTVVLTATAASGSTFTGWSGGGCSGTGTCTVTMDNDKSVTANFDLGNRSLSISKTGAGGGTVASSPAGINCGSACSASFPYSSTVVLTASAASGSTFTGWSGGCSGTGTCSVTMDNDKSVTANFALTSITPPKVYLPLIQKPRPNTLPVANSQSVTTWLGVAKSITLTASDANGDPLTWAIVSNPAHGSLSGKAPNLTYTPATNYSGSDSFTFKVNDGYGYSNVATVTITINPLIQNGGFESGRVIWTEYSSLNYYLIYSTAMGIPISPHGGSWLTWMGGDEEEDAGLSQSIYIPQGRSFLHYWFYSSSSEYCFDVFDVFGIFIGNTIVGSEQLCSSTATNQWVHRVVDLTAYAGTTQTLEFITSTDSSNYSYVFLDDVSLEKTASLSNSMDSIPLEGTLDNKAVRERLIQIREGVNFTGTNPGENQQKPR